MKTQIQASAFGYSINKVFNANNNFDLFQQLRTSLSDALPFVRRIWFKTLSDQDVMAKIIDWHNQNSNNYENYPSNVDDFFAFAKRNNYMKDIPDMIPPINP